METGSRVVRGPHWKWGNQDGGEGLVGTVVVVGRTGSSSSPDKTVVVQWDGGTRTNYRCGHENAYDLYLLDNGPIGVIHGNISCSECKCQGIQGLLWQCANCDSCSLCTVCYTTDKHSLEHVFYRLDTPSSPRIMVGKRQGKQKIKAQGTFRHANVVRGPDWDWGDQDGGNGPNKKGVVTDIRQWENETFNSVVAVTWANSEDNVYRRGHKGKVDVVCVSPTFGGYYYKDHLPKLGITSSSTQPVLSKQPALKSLHPCQFKVGDNVRVQLDADVLKPLQRDFGGWNDKMKKVIGVVGRVHRIKEKEGVRVVYPGHPNTCKWTFNPIALSLADDYHVNDSVCILDDAELVKKLQVGHGEWTENMSTILGKEGKIIKIYSDGDIRVAIDTACWTLNPAALAVRPISEKQFTPTPTQVPPFSTTPITAGTCTPASSTAALPTSEGPSAAAAPSTSATPEESLLPSMLEKMKLSPSDVTSQLISAAGLGQYTRVRDILAADPSKVNSNTKSKTALHLASHQGHVDIVKLLLKSGAQQNLQDNDGDTALHYACFGNKPLVAAALIQHGANMNIPNTKQCTPLHVAVYKGYTEVVQMLVNGDCDVNAQDLLGDTALHDAITKDQPDIINTLTNCGSCDLMLVNNQGFNPFHKAALKGREQALTALLAKCPALLNRTKDDGFTALHLSSLNGHLAVVRILLEHSGCEVNLVNENHQTALLLAVDKHHIDIVKELLEHGADANIQDDVGDTPLHTAAATVSLENAAGVTDMINLLIQHGADLTLCNHNNKIAKDLCENSDVAKILTTNRTSSVEIVRPGTYQTNADSPVPENKPMPSMLVSMATAGDCRLCCEPVDCTFMPCRHAVVCFGCGHMFKTCFQCKTTVEGVIKLEEPVKKECVVCSDLPAEVVFEPCTHKVVCTECSIRMKKCIVCQQQISIKRGPDGAIMNPAERYGTNMDSLVYLEGKVREMEEAHVCAICMEKQRNVVFLCGHSTCDECCQSLRDCPMCRKTIEKRIPLFS